MRTSTICGFAILGLAGLRRLVLPSAPVLDVEPIQEDEASASPVDTHMWNVLADIIDEAHPGSPLQPGLIVGGTDARYYRPTGSVVYGAGIFSPDIDMTDFGSRFHGNNERIDLESLRLVTDFWGRIVRGFDEHQRP